MATEKWKAANRDRVRKNQKDWYDKNKEKAKQWVRDREKRIEIWFSDYKNNLKCIKCGEMDSVCLDFHHRDPAKKDSNISVIVYQGWSINKILKEIEKCDILCANCHRKLHRDIKSFGFES